MAMPSGVPLNMSFIHQFVKFAITGTIGAVIDFGLFFILTRLLHWRTIVLVFGYPVIAANMVSVFVAIIVIFLFNKYWTFGDREHSAIRQGIQYFSFNFVTWVLNQLLTSYFAFHVVLFARLFGDYRDFAAKVMAIGIIMVVNFLGSKFLIFRKTPTTVAA